MKQKPWKRVETTLGLFLRHRFSPDPHLLLGYRLGGIARNMIIPPGGKVAPDDLGTFSACSREAKDEANLSATAGNKVAELRVTIAKKRLKMKVCVFLFTEWSGRLKNRTTEFKWLKFIRLSKIPWDLTPPGDQDWLTQVLVQHRHCLVHIACGTSRKHLLRIRIRPLP